MLTFPDCESTARPCADGLAAPTSTPCCGRSPTIGCDSPSESQTVTISTPSPLTDIACDEAWGLLARAVDVSLILPAPPSAPFSFLRPIYTPDDLARLVEVASDANIDPAPYNSPGGAIRCFPQHGLFVSAVAVYRVIELLAVNQSMVSPT
ncbi:hypothetical protein BT69DRAFT_290545 [Atractiella rhizophila]|nr:hypothetical protein BT69DRAFT_290545 [Atractiella rhizophila]